MSSLRAYWWTLSGRIRACAARIDAHTKPWRCRRKLKGRAGWLSVRIDARVGLFAQFNWVLMLLAHCEAHGLKPHIELTGPFYGDEIGRDWLGDLYLLDAGGEAPPVPVCTVSDIDELGLPESYQAQMTLERAHALWTRYARLDAGIAAHVDNFAAAHFAGRRVLGVHFRGTDKSSEAARVSWRALASTVNAAAETHACDAVFVASDEQAFVDFMLENTVGRPLIVHADELRAHGSEAVHVRPQPGKNRIKAREALVNALLLSRCAALVRSASFLSGWASVFNPGLPVILLNRPYDYALWFPDREVLKRYPPAARAHASTVRPPG
ncbi:MAG: hypothetical protein ACK4R8_01455 [Thiobacillus sp.]